LAPLKSQSNSVFALILGQPLGTANRVAAASSDGERLAHIATLPAALFSPAPKQGILRATLSRQARKRAARQGAKNRARYRTLN
jgi:hypothetical protein